MLKKQGITLEIDAEARKALALEGFTPKYGARPLRGVIRNRLRRPLSKMIVSGELPKGSIIKLKLTEGGEFEWDNGDLKAEVVEVKKSNGKSKVVEDLKSEVIEEDIADLKSEAMEDGITNPD